MLLRTEPARIESLLKAGKSVKLERSVINVLLFASFQNQTMAPTDLGFWSRNHHRKEKIPDYHQFYIPKNKQKI